MTTVHIKSGSLVLISGVPGAGKSSLKALAQGFKDLDNAWLSMDNLRLNLLGDYAELSDDGQVVQSIPQSANNMVYKLLLDTLGVRLAHGRTCLVEGIFLKDSARKEFFDLAKRMGVDFQVLILDTPLDACLAANRSRKYFVPESVIKNAHAELERSSVYPFTVIERGAVLQNQLPELNGEAWDVVGDVHGLRDEFVQLLANVGWRVEAGAFKHPQGRKLLVLGDLVDRGYDSLGVLRLLQATVRNGDARIVMGNHDLKLAQFFDAASSQGIDSWRSRANADTGMALMKAPDGKALAAFIKTFEPFITVQTKDGIRLAFVHAVLKHFEPGITGKEECIFGHFRYNEQGQDFDYRYQQAYDKGVTDWTLIRGHVPQTSKQPNIFSLENQAFQNGTLMLMHLDKFLSAIRAGMQNEDAFEASLVQLAVAYDFEQVRQKYALTSSMEMLVKEKLATCQVDESKLLRIFKYSKRTFWENRWGESQSLLKARGLVLDLGGNIISHPFDKVFNFGEQGTGLALAEDKPVVCVAKENGFLGIVSGHPTKRGELLAHTQGSFGGDFVEYLRHYVYQPKVRGAIAKYLSQNDVTLMFEVIHPEDPHIIEYPEADQGLWLLGVRGKGQLDKAWPEHLVDEAAAVMGLRRPKWFKATLGEVRAQVKTTKTEGFMVREDTDEQDFILKWKSPYYLTTKFVGRLSANKIAHLYAAPENFKQSVDEEFYPLVDLLTQKIPQAQFETLSQDERVVVVRDIINDMVGYA